MNTLDKNWHLAQDEISIQVSEFELQLWRVFYGFTRWQEECEKSVNGTDLTANELAVLHIIRMKEKPKTVYDIGRLLNRNDTYNIIYSIRKLLKLGLIEKVKYSPNDKKTNKTTLAYQITEEGIQNTDTYTSTRAEVLITMFENEKDINLKDLVRIFTKLNALYNEADRTVSTYAKPQIIISKAKKKANA